MPAVSSATVDASATDAAPSRVRSLGSGAMWLSLVPLWLLLHPYGGLLQDARIYIGRGVADRDPAGVGRDIMFAHDQQTGFSLMHGLVGAALHLVGFGEAALLLALAGSLVWIVGAIALARSLAAERVAWAAVVCMAALPARYGAFGIFNYAETLATPRVFAQAAVMGGLAAVTSRRPWLGAALLVRADPRWLVVVGLGAAGLCAAAALQVPVVARLIQPMDATWLAILRGRSTYLFPSLWPAESFGPLLCQATAVIAAAALVPRRPAELLLATLAVVLLGLGASWLFGDLHPGILIVQIQPWRALWLLALLGNASLALAVVEMSRRGRLGGMGAILLAMTWLSVDNLPVAIATAMLTLLVVLALCRDASVTVSRPVAWAGVALVAALCLISLVDTGSAALTATRAAERDGAGPVWPLAVSLGIARVPLVLFALAVACDRVRFRGRAARAGAAAALVCGVAAAALLWDARAPARRFVDGGAEDEALRQALGDGRGEILWIDEDSQSWFLAGRPSFMNSAQAGPILFSRDLALDWSARAQRLLTLGLVRPEDVAPWAIAERGTHLLPLTARSVAAFCADPRRPAALVAPGDQRDAVPAGLRTALWRPAVPLQRLVVAQSDLHWLTMDVFTVVQCRPPAPEVTTDASDQRHASNR